MHVLVTGANGLIGAAVVQAAQDAGHSVVGLVRSQAGAERLTSAGCQAHVGDLTAPASYQGALDGVDVVLHTAVGLGAGVTDADQEVVQVLVEALALRTGSLVLTSGLGVYTGMQVAFVDEGTSLAGAPPSQQSRIALEKQVLASAEHGVRPVVLRPAHVYGRGGAGLFTRMLMTAARAAGTGVFVGADGFGLFATVYVDDLAAAFVSAIDQPGALGTFNVVGNTMAMRDVATAMSHAIGGGGRIVSKPVPEALEAWGPLAYGLLGGPLVSSVRAAAELKWTPRGPSIAHELMYGSLKDLVR